MTSTPYKHGQPIEIQGFDLGNREVWEAAKIRKPRASELPKPGDDWYLVEFPANKARLYIHETRLRDQETK